MTINPIIGFVVLCLALWVAVTVIDAHIRQPWVRVAAEIQRAGE